MLERTCSQDPNNAPITIANGFRAACAPLRQIISRLWASRLGQRCGSRSMRIVQHAVSGHAAE
jgi:hypothetical protein